MKIVYNSILPPSGYKAINIYGILFARNGANIDQETLNHEGTHTEQMDDFTAGQSWLRPIGGTIFYLWYGIEFLIRLIKYQNWHTAYRAISFEQEAYANEDNDDYNDTRSRFSWLDYL